MTLKLIEFQEQFLNDIFLIKLIKFEKTGSIGKCFISLGNLIMKFRFINWKSIMFFVIFTLSVFNKGACLSFNKGNEKNLKRNQKSKCEKINLSLSKFDDFLGKTRKNHHDLFKSLNKVHRLLNQQQKSHLFFVSL